MIFKRSSSKSNLKKKSERNQNQGSDCRDKAAVRAEALKHTPLCWHKEPNSSGQEGRAFYEKNKRRNEIKVKGENTSSRRLHFKCY